MKTLKEIIVSYDKATASGKRTALVTVVHVEGSSYRQPGARMLIDDEGNVTGAISGGCLEGDALRKAQLVIAKQDAKLVTYDTSNETDISIGVQLGCEGIIQVLFEPIDASQINNPIEIIRAAVHSKVSVIVTCFDFNDKNNHQPGTCAVFRTNTNNLINTPALSDCDFLIEDVAQTFVKQISQFIEYKGHAYRIDAFLEFLTSPIKLVVVGAGNDAIPLTKIANILGWDTLVIDGRDAYAKPERFESSCQVMVLKPEQLLEKINIDYRTAFVLVTHNYNYDKAVLKYLLPLHFAYIGLLGPKKKLNRILDDLRNEGMLISDAMLKKLFGPTGFDIGAETPDEIALSVLSEIQSIMNDKSGGSLRDKTDVLHDREKNVFHQKILKDEK